MKTFDMTPTWSALTPVLTEVLRSTDDPKTLDDIRTQFARMATAADSWNTFAKSRSTGEPIPNPPSTLDLNAIAERTTSWLNGRGDPNDEDRQAIKVAWECQGEYAEHWPKTAWIERDEEGEILGLVLCGHCGTISDTNGETY